MLKIDVLADMQRLYPHPVLPVTSVTESVRQTLGFADIFEATLIRLLLAQRPRRSRRTTSREGKEDGLARAKMWFTGIVTEFSKINCKRKELDTSLRRHKELKVRVQNTADRYLLSEILVSLRAIVNV